MGQILPTVTPSCPPQGTAMKGHRVVLPTGPLTVGRQDVLGLAARTVAAGHHRERDGELDVEELQTLLLGCQCHDLLLEPLVLLLQRVQGFEHFYNCREEKGGRGTGSGERTGDGRKRRGSTEVPQLDHTGGGDWSQITVPLPATPPVAQTRALSPTQLLCLWA